MPSVMDVLSGKGSQVFTISADASVLEAALVMNEHKIGALVVSEGGHVHGMFTERDMLRRVVALRKDPAHTRVGDVMTDEVVVCEEGCDIEDARAIFRDRRIRHLPIVDQSGRLKGMLSIGDVNAFQLHKHEVHIHFLEEYLYGRV